MLNFSNKNVFSLFFRDSAVEIEESDYSELIVTYSYYGDNLHDRCLNVEKYTFGTLYKYAPGYEGYIEELRKEAWNDYLDAIFARFDQDGE